MGWGAETPKDLVMGLCLVSALELDSLMDSELAIHLVTELG